MVEEDGPLHVVEEEQPLHVVGLLSEASADTAAVTGWMETTV